MPREKDTWFSAWFNTPYYHILYKDRDNKEAGLFMSRLTEFLQLPENGAILDLACGRGRHARFLNALGYDVTGVDLSPSNIAYAKQFEKEELHFDVHDMCIPYPKKFDAVFNLFTSFGYFEKEEDNLRTIQAIKDELKPNASGVIDFLNVNLVEKDLVPYEKKKIEGITFEIEKYMEEGYIFKKISFTDKGKDFCYTERVKALGLLDFKDYFTAAGVTLRHCLGDYKLTEFNEMHSERLILIFSR
jgi:SAM-dependent methyltransferase